MKSGTFIGRTEFKSRGFLGSGGTGRFRNRLWAAIARDVSRVRDDEEVAKDADKIREKVSRKLNVST